MKSRSTLQIVFLVLAVIATACTKKKELKNEVDPQAYSRKSDFQGKEFFLSAGIEDSQGDNELFNATPGMNIDYGLVRAEITEKELRFVEVVNTLNRDATANILAAYPITQFDIVRDTNDFGEETNKIVEKTDRPWTKRQFMRVDWANPVAKRGKLDFVVMYGVEDLATENVTLLKDVKEVNGHIEIAVDATVIQPNVGKWGTPKTSRVKLTTHLVKPKTSDFQSVEYTDKDFSRFGYFYTEQLLNDPLRGLRDSGVKHFAEKFNVCKPGSGRSCSSNQVVWHLTENFPQEYVKQAQKAVEQYNNALKKILKRSDDVVVLDLEHPVGLTDPTVNTIAYYAEQNDGAPLGVRQNQVDPRTGEILGARVIMYGAGIDSMKGEIDDYIDMLVESGDAASIGLKTDDGEEKEDSKILVKGIAANGNSVKVAKVSVIQNLEAQRQALGIKTSSVGNLNVQAKVSSLKDHLVQSRSNLDARYTKMTDLVSKQFSNMADFQKISVDSKETSADLMKSLVEAGPNMLKEKQRLNTPIRFANVKIEAEGSHNIDFIEDAVLRFIERTLQEEGAVEKLSQQREIVKQKASQLAFYSVLLHEMGHAFGLRHNFAGSADPANYTDVYKEKVQKILKGDKSITPDDLAGSSYSSIMDYSADFFIDDADLGPYDKAALEYTYGDLGTLKPADREKELAKVDKSGVPTNPLIKGRYKFCTDDNEGETITCRRWDRGANASMITSHAIDRTDSSYLMSHFRRHRLGTPEHAWGRPNLGRMFMNQIRIRQPMDEFLYSLIVNNPSCGNGSIGQAIARGEMLDICGQPALAEKLGIDMSDLSTFSKALYKADGTGFVKSPSLYAPNGFADLLFASTIATNYFQKLLGAPEPGNYLVEEQLVGKEKKMVLTKLADGAPVEEALAALAEERGVPADVFVPENAKKVLGMEAGKFAKYLDSTLEAGAFDRKVARIGFMWDKIAATAALGARYIGVQKYVDASMTANAYLMPQAQKTVHAIFDKLISAESEKKYVTSVALMQDGKIINALVPAAVNLDVEIQAMITALGSFSSETDRSFISSTRICMDNEACPSAGNLKWTKFVGVQGNTYKAAQTIDGNSMAVDLLQKGADLNDKRKDVTEKISKRGALKTELLAKAKKKDKDREKSDLEKRLTDFVGDEGAAKAYAALHPMVASVVTELDPKKTGQMRQLLIDSYKGFQAARQDWAKKAMDKLTKAGVDPQACTNQDGSVKKDDAKCAMYAEANDLIQELDKATNDVLQIAVDALDVASLEGEVETINRETSTVESRVQLMKSLYDAFTRM